MKMDSEWVGADAQMINGWTVDCNGGWIIVVECSLFYLYSISST